MQAVLYCCVIYPLGPALDDAELGILITQVAQQGSTGGFAFVRTFRLTTPWRYLLEIFQLDLQPLSKRRFVSGLGID